MIFLIFWGSSNLALVELEIRSWEFNLLKSAYTTQGETDTVQNLFSEVRWGEVRWYWWSWYLQPATTAKCPKVAAFAYCVVGWWWSDLREECIYCSCFLWEWDQPVVEKKKRGFLVFSALESWQSHWRRKLGVNGLFLKVASFSGGEKKSAADTDHARCVFTLHKTLMITTFCMHMEFMKWSALHIITQVRWW
jgi:hypothetical protein